MTQTLYMIVSADKYQLPEFVSPNMTEVAEYMGMKVQSLFAALREYQDGTRKGYPFIVKTEVDIDDEDYQYTKKERKTKHVLQYTKDGKFVAEYSSVKEAAEKVQGLWKRIQFSCGGYTKTAYGYVWKYKE